MARLKVVRNTEGYISGGTFHPIRSGVGYDPSLAGEKARKKRKPAKKAAKKRTGRKAVAKRTTKARKKKNPALGVPRNKWFKGLVKINSNGTVTVARTK